MITISIRRTKGKAFSFGLYDELRYEGFVYVGQSLWDQKARRFVSSETPEFVAECIATYWKDYGIRRYRNCNEILILADAGESNEYRARMWKFKLYEQLATKFGMHVTVCHYPPEASKQMKPRRKHKLFSEISKNWKGTPLCLHPYLSTLNCNPRKFRDC